MRVIFENLFGKLLRTLYYIAGNLRAGWLGVRLGPHARISPRCTIDGAAFIGNATVAGAAHIGPGTYIGSGAIDSGAIGAFCSIGYGVHIGPTEHNTGNWTTSPFLMRAAGEDHRCSTLDAAAPRIGCDVWIGAGAIILRGVVIGDGAVIGAASLVRKSIPAYEIWAGVPARKIRSRFSNPAQMEHARQKLAAELDRLGVNTDRWRVADAP